ncbi:MAG: FliO/MopB family protein [Bacillota bacterium]|jgi:flagellar protein FliO/FliZ
MPNNFENQPYHPSSPAPAVSAGEPFSWSGLIGTVIIFLIVLIIVLWLINRLNQYSYRSKGSLWVKVLDRQVLNGRQVLYLVEIAGKIQVLGGTDHHLTKLEEINDPEIIVDILEEINKRPQENMASFVSGIWKRIQNRKNKEQFSSELERLLEEVDR